METDKISDTLLSLAEMIRTTPTTEEFIGQDLERIRENVVALCSEYPVLDSIHKDLVALQKKIAD